MTVKNTLLFVVFSFVYTYVISCISSGVTAIDYEKFVAFVDSNILQLSLGIVSFIAIFFFIKSMEYLFLLYCILLNISVFTYFYQSFDKLILVFNFFFMIISYIFYLFIKAESDEAIYNPKFKHNFLGRKSEYKLPCRINSRGTEYQGYLTNWDKSGVFVYFKETERVRLSGKIGLEFEFGNNVFKSNGVVRTVYDNGYGISISRGEEDLDWKKLFNLLEDRGFKPRYI